MAKSQKNQDSWIELNLSEIVRRTFIITIIILVAFSYPLACLPPFFFDAYYEIKIPSQSILTLIGLALISTTYFLPQREIVLLLLVYLFSLSLHVLFGKNYNIEAMNVAGMAIIPFAISCCVRASTWFTFSSVSRIASALWFYQVLYVIWTRVAPGLLKTGRGTEVTGFAGNRNWMAALILYLAIWAFGWLCQQLNRRYGWVKWKRNTVSLILIAIPTLWILSLCDCRGAWVALSIILFLGILIPINHSRPSIGKRVILYGFILVCAASTYIVANQSTLLNHAIRGDIRLPLWRSTLNVILDNKIGVGPGEVRQHLVEYLSRSTYHERPVAASVTIHPHNELLNVCAQLGILAGICWLLLFYPIVYCLKSRNMLYRYGAYSTLAIAIPSLFDMTFVMPPTSFLGLVSLGICWSKLSRKSPAWQAFYKSSKKTPAIQLITFSTIILVCIFMVGKSIHKTSIARQGLIHYKMGNFSNSLQCWRQIIQQNPEDLHALFMAAHLISYELNSHSLAEEGRRYALQIYRQDPNYAHINGVLARLMIIQGMEDQSIIDLLLRECRLYPQAINGYDVLYRYLFLTNRIQALPIIKNHIEEVWLNQIRIRFPDEMIIADRIKNWIRDVEGNNPDAAVRSANQFLVSGTWSILDPALIGQLNNSDPIVNKLKSGFNHGDFRYWREKFILQRIGEECGTIDESNQIDISIELPERLFGYVEKNLKLIPENTKLEPISAIWKHRSGGLMSLYYFYGLLAREHGMRYRILMSDERQPMSAEIHYRDSIYHVNLEKKTFQLAESGTNHALRNFFIPFPIHEYVLKNRILGLILRDYVSERYLRLSEFPSLTIARDLKAFGIQGAPNTSQFSKFLLCPQLNPM